MIAYIKKVDPNGYSVPWIYKNFEDQDMLDVVNRLNKIISDLRSLEIFANQIN